MPDTERRTFRDWFEESATDPLVFLLGVQGSGTNLTARILQSVFEYTAVLDGSLIFNGALQVERRPTRAVIVREFERIHRRLFPGPWRRRIAIRHYHHRNEGFRGIEQHFDPHLIDGGAAFARFFYAYKAWALERRRILVKSDDLWENIDGLGRLFPNRKCVLLVRDLRDNALSLSRKDFGPRDLYLAACLTNRQLTCYRREADRTPDDTLTVLYETLLGRPMEFVQEFAAKFGLAAPHDAAERIERLRIRSDNSQKWRRIPDQHLAACEWVLKKHLLDFGYELSGRTLLPLSLPARIGHTIGNAIQCIPQKVGRLRQSIAESPAGVTAR